MSYDSSRHGLHIRRDAGSAAMLGPLRLIVTTIGTLILYRVVLARAGLDIIGIWSMLNVIGTLISLVDVGFSQVLTRKTDVADGPEGATESLLDKCAAELVYRCF